MDDRDEDINSTRRWIGLDEGESTVTQQAMARALCGIWEELRLLRRARNDEGE